MEGHVILQGEDIAEKRKDIKLDFIFEKFSEAMGLLNHI